LVTGQYPHEHGTFSRTDSIESTPLLADLGERGYLRYGVSANGFASPKYGFDKEFDEFYNTQAQMVFPEAFDVHGYARRVQDEQGSFSPEDVSAIDLLRAVLTHSQPLKSLANVSAATLTELVGRYDTLQRVPHPRFNQYSEFCYSPEKNTRMISDVLHSTPDDQPFFLFTNYMDPHHPYAPPEQQQRRCCGRTFSFKELSRYALIMVTADHGENLGEADRMGESRFGHVCSISDYLLRVPLLIAHPDLESRDISEYVSLKDIRGLVTEPEPLLNSAGKDIDPLEPEDGIVSGQLPGGTSDALLQRYPEMADTLRRHMIGIYTEGWKVVVTSTDDPRAWNEGKERPVDEAPEKLVETAREQLADLVRAAGSDRGLSEADQAHLEALGYL